MKLSLSNILILLLVIFAGLNIFSNYRQFRLYQNLDIVRAQLLNNTYEFDSLFLKNLNVDYPNLTNTAIPLKTVIGANYLRSGDSLLIRKGLDYQYKAIRENPYIGFPEQVLANYYQFYGFNKDSFEFYARKSIKILPNNPTHFVLMSRVYAEQDKQDSIFSEFERIIKKVPNDNLVWRVFLGSMASENNRINDKIDSVKVKEYAYKAKDLFTYGTSTINDEVHLLADYVIYGQENMKSAIKKRTLALDLIANNNFKEAKSNLMDLTKSYPDVVQFYEDLIYANYSLKDYNSIIQTHQLMNEKGLTEINTNILEFIMISYFQYGYKRQGCILVNLLRKANYPLSESALSQCI